MRDPGETRRVRYTRFRLAAPVRGGRTSCGSLLGQGEFHFSAAKQKAARGWKMDTLKLNSLSLSPATLLTIIGFLLSLFFFNKIGTKHLYSLSKLHFETVGLR